MRATGIGFAGLDGAWWLPATRPFALSHAHQGQLNEAAMAIFVLLDVVGDLFQTPLGAASGLDALLRWKTPAHLHAYLDRSPVYSLRPDFQLHSTGDDLDFVATELEICPSAQGFAHAMQLGYGLPPDLLERFVAYLAGRPLLIVGTEQWSEFLIEQLAFCKSLAAYAAEGYVLYDRPLSRLADEFAAGQRWQPPMFGIPRKPAGWNQNLLARLAAQGLLKHWLGEDGQWPSAVGHAVVFRFGYLECFAPQRLTALASWQRQGATLLNPLSFLYENKSLLAALQLPAIRQEIARRSPTALPTLDRGIAPTLLLNEETAASVIEERAAWVLKFAGFDSGNQAWGGRSLQIGATHDQASWRGVVERYLSLPFPVVAQRLIPSLRLDIDYFDGASQVQKMLQGTTRLRAFLLRGEAMLATPSGVHLTVAAGTQQVSEASDTVQAPVVFVAEDAQG